MVLTESQCNVVLKEAFKDEQIPSCTAEDVNRVLSLCKDNVIHAVELKLTTDKSYHELSKILGYKGNYSYELYMRFIRKLRFADRYDWYRYDEIEYTRDTDLVFLDISFRTYNGLRRAGLNTIDDVCKLTLYELSQLKGMGVATATEITDKLKELGFNVEGSDSKKEYKYVVKTGPGTLVTPEMLDFVRKKCIDRTYEMGYEKSCRECSYRGTGDGCMFNKQPRNWEVNSKAKSVMEKFNEAASMM